MQKGEKQMAKQKYALNSGERIIIKESCVRHGFWGVYTHTLVVTNQAVILEEYGMFNNFKGIKRYPYELMKQAIQGKATNGEKQIELYMENSTEDFALQSGDEIKLKTLVMAINDQLSSEKENYDYDYYQTIIDGTEQAEKQIEKSIYASNVESKTESGMAFVGDVASNVLKSGDFSLRGVKKGINKATGKKVKKGLLAGFMDEVLDDIGVHDIQDAFTEIGNDFREEFGLGHKMTHEERRELEEQEAKRQEAELKARKKDAFNQTVLKAKQQAGIYTEVESSVPEQANGEAHKSEKMSINEQLDTLKKLKELMDAGILTQEEFDIKKKEIMGL
jgi:hypothetical protein